MASYNEMVGALSNREVKNASELDASTLNRITAAKQIIDQRIPSEMERRRQAEALYNPAYQQTIDSISAQRASTDTRYTNQANEYKRYIDEQLGETENAVLDAMIKRGMGRSSRAAYELSTALADVQEQGNQYLGDLEEQRLDILNSLDAQASTAASTYEQQVAAKILDLNQYWEGVRQFNEQQAARERELEMQKALQEQQMAEQTRQFELQFAEQQRQFNEQMAKASRGGGGGGGGGYQINIGNDSAGAYASTTTPQQQSGARASYAARPVTQTNYTGKKDGKYYIGGKQVSADAYYARQRSQNNSRR
jgi:hypothetical protein